MYDLIVPMAGGVTPEGELTGMYRSRLKGALREYASRDDAGILVQGGFGHFNVTDRPVAQYGRDFLLEEGIPGRNIFAIDETASTVEEALSAQRFVAGMPARTLCVVSSLLHIERCRFVFECFFPSEQLESVGTPNDVSPEELKRRVKHEVGAMQLLRSQGGVILEGKLFVHGGDSRLDVPFQGRSRG